MVRVVPAKSQKQPGKIKMNFEDIEKSRAEEMHKRSEEEKKKRYDENRRSFREAKRSSVSTNQVRNIRHGHVGDQKTRQEKCVMLQQNGMLINLMGFGFAGR